MPKKRDTRSDLQSHILFLENEAAELKHLLATAILTPERRAVFERELQILEQTLKQYLSAL